MKITVAYNLRTEGTEEQAELLSQEDVDRICKALEELRHKITAVEVSGSPQGVVEKLLASEPDLIFNIAEGTIGRSREAFYPALYEQLRIPFTGGDASLLHMNLDKNLAKTVVASQGIRVPQGVFVNKKNQTIPSSLQYPLILKPNSEGSSKGITQESVVENPKECQKQIERLLPLYPLGLVVEEFIPGREFSVPFLEGYPGKLLEIVEHTFDLKGIGGKYNIYDYDMKQLGERNKGVTIVCPPVVSEEERKEVIEFSKKIFTIMPCPDFGRVDIRLHEDGTPYFIELNPLPCLHPKASLMTSAKICGLEYKEVFRLIIRSAAKRYKLAIRPYKKPSIKKGEPSIGRPTVRELGINIGRFQPGIYNAITDVKGIKVGHLTNISDNVKIPGTVGTTSIRTGITAILPSGGNIFNRRLVGGGFILNGIGEMAGLTQVKEWGWLETPILLTNSHSVGKVHSGVISYLTRKYPHLGVETDVILPVVGETDDSFLNDVRIGVNTSQDAVKAIENAKTGPVVQGAVGAGTGMVTFDFAGGIGTCSRVIPLGEHNFILGVLVLSNFGRMQNLTIDGKVAGRELEPLFLHERRVKSYGSVIVVVATDAPLLSSQLSRISKRAALGLGRVGSHAASTSGEIIIAFSTANRSVRTPDKPNKYLNLKFISDVYVNNLYEAVIEATEEAVLNSIFCSNGMKGRNDRFAPAVPQDKVIDFLRKGREIHVSH